MRILALTVVGMLVACAAIIPDWNTRNLDNTSDKPRIQVIVSPWGPQLCDKDIDPTTKKHYRSVSVVLSQHNKEFEETFITDNKHGTRFKAMQSVSANFRAGLGTHHLEFGTYIYDEEGNIKITWQGERTYQIRCCHVEQGSNKRRAG